MSCGCLFTYFSRWDSRSAKDKDAWLGRYLRSRVSGWLVIKTYTSMSNLIPPRLSRLKLLLKFALERSWLSLTLTLLEHAQKVLVIASIQIQLFKLLFHLLLHLSNERVVKMACFGSVFGRCFIVTARVVHLAQTLLLLFAVHFLIN